MANGIFPNQQNYLALSGRPPAQQLPQAPLAGAGGSNPMAAILMGLGGGLSSRASGGTLGEGFGQGARLGMSMAQAKQLRGKQGEVDAREERRLNILEDKRAEEESAFKSREKFRTSALAGNYPPHVKRGLAGTEKPRQYLSKYEEKQAGDVKKQANVYSGEATKILGFNPAKSRELGNTMSKFPDSADSIWRYAEATGNSYLPPDVLERLGRGETFDRIDPDGAVIMRPAPPTADPTGRRLFSPPGAYRAQ